MADQYTVTVRLQGQNQLTPAVGQATQSLRGLTQEAGRTNAAMNQLKTIGMGLFAGVSAAGVVRMAEDLYQTGMAAQRAGNLFRSFGAQIGDTDAVLARMRETTRGVVKDVDLMNAANSMLSMGLAKNAEDVQRLTDIGVTFAQAMGQDVGASLENLNMILANQSYLRLDTLGISSSQVRELAAQYRAAGMDSSEAFTAAFLEVAEGKLPQMAAVADATVTELQKMQTSLDNWWADFGNRFATGVNGLIGMVGLLDDVLQRVLDAAAPVLNDVGDLVISGEIGPSMMGGSDLLPGRNVTPAMYGQMLRMQARSGNYAMIAPYQQAMWDLAGYAPFANAAHSRPLAFPAPQLYDPAREAGMLSYGLPAQRSPTDIYAQQRQYREWLMSMSGQFYGIGQAAYAGGFQRSGVTLFSDEDVRRAEMAANRVQDMVDAAERWNDVTGRQMVSEDDLAIMEGMAQNARGWADEVARGAAAMESLTLSQRFGQTSGGARQEMYDSVLRSMEAAGMGDDQLAALSQQFGMDSGAVTGMSAQWHNTVAPLLAEIGTQLGGEAVSIWLDAYDAAQREAMQRGYTGPLALDLISQQADIIPLQGDFSGGGGAGDYTVKAGDTVWGLARAAGQTTTEYMAAHGLTDSMLRIGQTIPGGGSDSGRIWGWDPSEITASMDEAATSASGITDEMTTATETLQTGLDTAFGKQYRVEMALDVTDINVTPAFKNALTQVVAEIVRGQGGTTPGQTHSGGRSSRTSD